MYFDENNYHIKVFWYKLKQYLKQEIMEQELNSTYIPPDAFVYMMRLAMTVQFGD